MFFLNMLGFISFPMLQTRSLYVEYEGKYSHLKLSNIQDQMMPERPLHPSGYLSYLTCYFFINIQGFISFPMLQTRSLYVEYKGKYSHLKFTYIQNQVTLERC